MSLRALTQRRGVPIYFALTFAISWTGALIVAAPALLHNGTLSKERGIFLFPAMILGPCLSGIILNSLAGGTPALRRMVFRMSPGRLAPVWYLAVAVPPLLILGVLFSMSSLVSSHFAPNLFWLGIFFGLPAGFIEEIGWTGFALPHMIERRGVFPQSVLLGLLWGLWHVPAIDFLGAATPHGPYLLPFFLAFTAALTGLRVLMAWLYANTGSILLAQLVHASSTGSLVLFSPPAVTAGEEAVWYLGYAAALWAVVGLVWLRCRHFGGPHAKPA